MEVINVLEPAKNLLEEAKQTSYNDERISENKSFDESKVEEKR